MSCQILICFSILAFIGCPEQPIAPGDTAKSNRVAADGGQRMHATRERNVIQITPSGFRFKLPEKWLDWHRKFGNNLHLSVKELDAVKLAKSEWDTEYAQVTNAVFPFSRCAAHVGGEGWGRNAVSYGDLQVRIYDLQESADKIEEMIDRQGAKAVTELTKEKAKAELSRQGDWRRGLLKYPRFYGDYGATAFVDIRYREFPQHTIAFVFMYTNFRSHADEIEAMQKSLMPPEDE